MLTPIGINHKVKVGKRVLLEEVVVFSVCSLRIYLTSSGGQLRHYHGGFLIGTVYADTSGI